MNGHAPILVVEDNKDDVTLIRRTLTNACIPNPLRFVETGEDAIDYLVGVGPYSDRKTSPLPALVLLDLKLPGMDGFKVLEWIRSHRHFKDLRVMVLTSSNDVYDVRKGYRLGANSFLVKPLEFENLRGLFSAIQWQLTETNITAPATLPPRTVIVESD